MNDPGTFSQIYIQIIFAGITRNTLISKIWEEELYKYISGIIANKKQKLFAINGMEDHIHILIGLMKEALHRKILDGKLVLEPFPTHNLPYRRSSPI